MSRGACAKVADLYNLIEEEEPWPKGCTVAEVAFLPQDGAQEGEIISNRLLLIMSVLYRKWAAIRLRRPSPWVEK